MLRYSASILERLIVAYFLTVQETRFGPKNDAIAKSGLMATGTTSLVSITISMKVKGSSFGIVDAMRLRVWMENIKECV